MLWNLVFFLEQRLQQVYIRIPNYDIFLVASVYLLKDSLLFDRISCIHPFFLLYCRYFTWKVNGSRVSVSKCQKSKRPGAQSPSAQSPKVQVSRTQTSILQASRVQVPRVKASIDQACRRPESKHPRVQSPGVSLSV